MKPFFGPIYVDWFKAFPCPEPTVEELAEAKGARDVAKATLEAKIKSCVYYWFFNHTRGSTSGAGNRDILRLTKRRKLQLFQAYSHLYYESKLKDVINEKYEEHLAEAAKKDQLSQFEFAAKITRELLADETPKVMAEVEAYRQKLVTSDTITLESDDEGAEDTKEEQQQQQERNKKMQRAIDRLPSTMQSVLQAIEAQTGWPCILLAGGPCPKLGGKLEVVSMQRGTTRDTEEEFQDTVDDWEGLFIQPFNEFLKRVFPPDLCAQVALRRSSPDSSDSESTVESRAQTPLGSNTARKKSKPAKIRTRKDPSVKPAVKGLSDYEIERNANIAHNKALLAQLDKQFGTAPMSSARPVPLAKKVRKPRKKPEPIPEHQRRRGRSAKNKFKSAETIDDDERDDSGDSQDGNGNDDDGDNEADGHGNNDDGDNEADGNGSDGQGSDCEDEGNTAVGGSTPPTNDAKDGKSKPLKPTKADTPGPSTRAKTDAKGVAVTRPEWMSHSKNYLLGIEGRDSWEKLVQSWMVFEERLGYPDRENRSHWLNPKGRPEEVKFWNGRGKKLTVVPVFKPGEFAVVWKNWWESLQPTWRLRETWPLSRKTPSGEDWSVLRRGGINGMFIVLMCLSWWTLKKLSAKERDVFEGAKSDVVWVIQQVSDSLVLPSELKRRGEDLPNAKSPKRLPFDLHC